MSVLINILQGCDDNLPSGWRDEHELHDGISCKSFNCERLASSDVCNVDASSQTLAITTCVYRSEDQKNNLHVPIKEFCKKSCKNCGDGRYLNNSLYISRTFVILELCV